MTNPFDDDIDPADLPSDAEFAEYFSQKSVVVPPPATPATPADKPREQPVQAAAPIVPPMNVSPLRPDNWPRLRSDDKPPHLCTDQANGYRIAHEIGRDLLYVVRIGWHAWRKTHWHLGEEFAYRNAQKLSRLILKEAADLTAQASKTEDAEKREQLISIAKELTGWAGRSESRTLIYAAMELAKPLLAIEHQELDREHWLLNCTNGVIDLRTGLIHPHHRDDFITRCVPVTYDPKATCPLWLAFLNRIFAGNAELIHFVQKAIGYSLTGDTSEQCVFFLWGSGHNGKSTLVGAVQAMMGAYAQQAAPDLLVVSKHERHSTEIAELRGARLITAIETGEGRRLNEPLIKQMSGGDKMRGRFMRQDNFEFDPTHKIFLATNHKPVIRGTDYAMWRRIRLIPFTVTIPPAERDKKLPEKLKTELAGVLAWAVKGCLSWQQEGLEPPREIIDATNQYKAESDVLAAFLDDCCVIDIKAKATGQALYDAYKQWCSQAGENAESNTSFGLRLVGLGYQKRRGAAGIVYDGLGLRTAPEKAGEL